MLRALVVLLVLSASSTLGPARTHAQVETSLLRCAGGTVRIGDSMGRVADACGSPIERGTDFERVGRSWVPLDVWRFDLGPGAYVEDLSFANGALYRIAAVARSTPRPTRITEP